MPISRLNLISTARVYWMEEVRQMPRSPGELGLQFAAP